MLHVTKDGRHIRVSRTTKNLQRCVFFRVYRFKKIIRFFSPFSSGEYGFGSFTPDTKLFVPFKTTFDQPPDGVTLALAGFVAHLDVHSYDDYDGLALDKYVGEITESGFYIDTRDLSDGMVDVNRIYCSWMACAGLYDSLHTY